MSCVPALSLNNYRKKGLNVLKLLTRLGAVLLLVVAFFNHLAAQKSIVLIDADLGRTIESIHKFSYDEQSFTLILKHRMTHNLPVEISLLRSERFKKGPYSLQNELPTEINPGESVNLTFNVDYSRSISDLSEVTLLISPVGDSDPTTRGITFRMELSAEGMMMFWDNRANKYTTTLPDFSFGSPGDQLLEVTWNGNGEGRANFAIDNNSRDAFKLISNTSAGTPVPPGSEIKLGKGGKSFFVRYAPPGRRLNSDAGTLVFTDINSGSNASGSLKTIMVALDAKGTNGTSIFLAGNNTEGVGTTTIIPNASGKSSDSERPGTMGNSTTSRSGTKGKSVKEAITSEEGTDEGAIIGTVALRGIGIGKVTPLTNWKVRKEAEKKPDAAKPSSLSNSGLETGGSVKGVIGSRNPDEEDGLGESENAAKDGLMPDRNGIDIGKEDTLGVLIEPDRVIVDPVTAMERLKTIYDGRKRYNHIIFPRIIFKKNPDGNEPDKYTTSIPVAFDTLFDDKNFKFTPHHVAAINSRDSIELQILFFDEDSLKFRVGIHPDDEPLVLAEDSFDLRVGLIPYYMAGDQPVYLEDENSILTGSTIGIIETESNWLLWLIIGIVLFLFLIFFFARMWVRQPIKSFRYLREAKYQRIRRKQQEGMTTFVTDTIYLDLSQHNSDLIQLNFLDKNPDDPGETIKKKVLESSVPTPGRSGLKRFFVWFYGLFGMDKKQHFNSVYYSFRIEPQKGGVPQHLKLKDDKGLLLLGTSMTQKVLATDHQDVRFTESPFTYTIFLDPTEILDYTGSMRSVSVLFRVLEEPFEGYLTTRDFKLDLELIVR